jgi:AcrR family transcriptional regulator
MSSSSKRAYTSEVRALAAEDTRRRILAAAKSLFGQRGIDAVTIAAIGSAAEVAASTVYAIYKSKEGILRALMEQVLFGDRFRAAEQLLAGVTDPVRRIELTSRVARAIYESESSDLGLLRHASGFSPALRCIEQEFEGLRYKMQRRRLQMLCDAGRQREGLALEQARQIMWMYTSREVYRLLVHDCHWTPDQYEQWLGRTLREALVRSDDTSVREPGHRARRRR